MKKISFVILALIIVFFLTIAIYIFQQFKVNKLYILSTAQTIKGLAEFNNQNLLLIDKNQIITRLLQQNNQWKSLNLEINLPNTVKLIAVDRIPKAKIKNQQIFYLDEEGFITPEYNNKNIELPIIEADRIKIFNENTVDWRVIKAMNYLTLLSQNNIKMSKLIIDSNSLTLNIFLDNGTKVITKQTDNPKNIVASLQTIISRFRIEGKFISTINFQFDKPVVTIANEEKNISI